ncbi:MAG: hypothetical protein LBO82_10175 [Synergistaceae bacterium]|jgi:hippurate hydrolase|nr:hypothetical protein [Synergistaceae bacterium]
MVSTLMISGEDVRVCAEKAESCFKHLHRYSKTGFEERETPKFIAQKLESYGFEKVRTGVGKTGVVADLVSYRARGDVSGLLPRCSGDGEPAP